VSQVAGVATGDEFLSLLRGTIFLGIGRFLRDNKTSATLAARPDAP
jgi:hypothetical protein